LSAVTNRSSFTRFSSSGGGALAGFEDGAPGQYRINQVNLESALMYKGFSWQSEFHHKNIVDKLDNDSKTKLLGYYVQAGYFVHQAMSWWPSPLELAFRYAHYEPDRDFDVYENEKSLNANWFFNDHKNKLSMEISYFNLEFVEPRAEDRWRFRVQWDISF